jgi:hypothetical protein
MMSRLVLALLSSSVVAAWVTSCAPTEPNELDKLGTVQLSIAKQPFVLWVADTAPERARGLMFVTADQMVPLPDGTERGMLFVFDHEQRLSFWMKNTVIPLDIAFLDSDGKIIAIHTMAPLDTRSNRYTSGVPARYAIEVNANKWMDLGIKSGDTVNIPISVLKDSP